MAEKAFKILISYAQEDIALRNELVAALEKQFGQRQDLIFHDEQISSGQDWKGEIGQHIDEAKVILFLISPDFMSSNYCEVEVERAIKRHEAQRVPVFPVILKTTNLEATPFRGLKALPYNNVPITQWEDRTVAFAGIARRVAYIIDSSFTADLYSEPYQLQQRRVDRSPVLGFDEDRSAKGFDEGTVAGLIYTATLGAKTTRKFIPQPQIEPSHPLQPESSCYIYAEMDDRVIIHRATTLEVTVSGDKIEFQSDPTAQEGTVNVDSAKRLIVQVIPKINFTIVDNDRVEVDPPSSGQQQKHYFDLRPTNLGEGEVWVVARQGQMPLLTLSIKPQIVEKRAQLRPVSSAPMTSAFPAMTVQPSGASSTKARADGSITDFPPLNVPLHELRIIEQRNGDQITYRYELESPELGILKDFVSKPIATKRQEFVENLYKEIESRWWSNQDDVEAFTAELRAFGGNLFDELFPYELQDLLWQHHSEIKSIMVLSTEPFIPWELVHLKQPGQNLPEEMQFLGQMGLVRWLFGTFPPQTIKVRQGRVGYVIPHYPDQRYYLPQAEKEAQFLEQTFQATLIEPQSTAVRKRLQAGDFDLLHFAGHGTAEQGNIGNAKLLLQGRVEGGRYIFDYLSPTTVEQFSKLKSKDNRPMVVLNACQIGREGYTLTSIGGFAQAFLNGGAGAFVGPLWSVGDSPARMFTETLYKGLIDGLILSEATIKARDCAKQAGDATWLAYAVYGHPHLKIQG